MNHQRLRGSDHLLSRAPVRCLVLLLSILLPGCEGSANRDETRLPLQDSVATAREVAASLEEAAAASSQEYTYRRLHAGMSRAELEARVVPDVPSHGESCAADSVHTRELVCDMDVRTAPDSMVAHIHVVYASEDAPATLLTSRVSRPTPNDGARSGLTAREITVSRALPLDVDGVSVAKALADAFERQTRLLDRREASYGHQQAIVRVGSMSSGRQNFAEVTVVTKGGREVLTVRLSRSPALTTK